MPNHCENDLVISNEMDYKDEESLKKFLEYAAGENGALDFNKFIPQGQKEIDSMGEPGIHPAWYTFNVENWGTKWNAYEIVVGDIDWGSVEINFQTAWSPPIPVVKKMGEMFPHLVFNLSYFEMGAAFNGWFQMTEGEVTENREGEYFGKRGG